MTKTNLKLVSHDPASDRAHRATRPFTTYYFAYGKRSPVRIARSSTPTAAIVAVIRRIGLGEKIAIAEVVDQQGKLQKTLKVHYGKITVWG